MSKKSGTDPVGQSRLRKAAGTLERRRDYLRGQIALAGNNASGYFSEECAALDEVLVALYDVRAVPHRPGVEPKNREYRYEQWESLADAIRAGGLLESDGEEWGYRRAPGWSVGLGHTRESAQQLADLHNDGAVVRRAVGHGPWEVA